MGQGIAEADMFVGIAGMAWLFHLSKNFDQITLPIEQEQKFSSIKRLTKWFNFFKHNIIGSAKCSNGPGTPFKPESAISHQSLQMTSCLAEKNPVLYSNSEFGRTATDPVVPLSNDVVTDPTLRFSHLLIAKPLPFEFDLRVRDQRRAEQLQRDFRVKMEKGDFPDEKKYWENEDYLGWGKV